MKTKLAQPILRKFYGANVELEIYDYDVSNATILIFEEMVKDIYGFNRIPFQSGDYVVDIGGHVGIASIFLAKKFPFLKIFAYEPFVDNFQCFQRNLEINRIENVKVYHSAVTSDGREIEMAVNPLNTGGGTAYSVVHPNYRVKSVTLDEIFEQHSIQACRLLKIDCEGAEHEILMTTKLLNRVEYLSGEFHINTRLKTMGYSIKTLYKHCIQFIQPQKLSFVTLKMCE